MFGPFSLAPPPLLFNKILAHCWKLSRYMSRSLFPTSSLAFIHLFSLPAVDLSFKLQVWLQHILSQRLPVERVIGGGEDVPLNVFPVAAIAAGQYHWVLHQLSHDCALKLSRYIVPFNLLFHSLNNQFVCSLSQGSKLSNVY